jgi:hypothetical protein
VWLKPDVLGLPFRVKNDLAAVVGRGLVGAAVEEIVAVAVALAEVEAAELLLLLGVLVVVSQVVGLGVADVDASRAGAAVGHDHGAAAAGILLVLLRDLHLVLAGSKLRGCVLASSSGSGIEVEREGVWRCWKLAAYLGTSTLKVTCHGRSAQHAGCTLHRPEVR